MTLASRFSLKDLGSLSYFLGVEVAQTPSGLFLSQRKYILDLLHKINMHEAKEISTLLSSNDALKLHDGCPITWHLQLIILDSSSLNVGRPTPSMVNMGPPTSCMANVGE